MKEPMTLTEMLAKLKEYDEAPLSFMEVCGSHTAAIAKYGIKSLLSDKIRLISGPGCPVCVTPTAYIDRLIELALEPDTCVVSFGDLLRVPGSKRSLSEAKADGAMVQMVYSPMEILELAEQNPSITYVFAAVGFETTTPVYALLLEQVIDKNLTNVKLLTALKTMPNVLQWLGEHGAAIDGFLAPGHVCAITGYELFEPLAKQLETPFVVSGFEDTELVVALYHLLQLAKEKKAVVKNCYPSIVEKQQNPVAMEKINRFFEPGDTSWRGIGVIEGSGMFLRAQYEQFDAGSRDLNEDVKRNKACACGEILIGKKTPFDCPLFGKVCTPYNPQGACMVSMEGSCHQNFLHKSC